MEQERTKLIKRASWIAIGGNTALAVLKIIIGIMSGSLAVVGAGIDTATDIITSLVTLFAAGIIAKPPDREHPYGHMRAETVATKLVSFVIFFAGAQLALKAIGLLIAGEAGAVPSVSAVYATVISIAGKIVLAYLLLTMGRRNESPMVIANGKNMMSDIFISASVLVGLVFTRLLRVPILDPIFALLVSIWVMKTAVSVFIESSEETMDTLRDSSVYDEVFTAVDEVAGASNPHRARIRKIGTYYDIDLDIEVEASITVERGHGIAIAVEDKIKERLQNVYDVMVHVEPRGNVEENEAYGRSQTDGQC
ncbi:MAG: cation transporter [Spirochaetales bacterium]|nr:cation transporter [Spirochaetales bacterium]